MTFANVHDNWVGATIPSILLFVFNAGNMRGDRTTALESERLKSLLDFAQFVYPHLSC